MRDSDCDLKSVAMERVTLCRSGNVIDDWLHLVLDSPRTKIDAAKDESFERCLLYRYELSFALCRYKSYVSYGLQGSYVHSMQDQY